MKGTNQPGNMQAPASLLAKVETRLRAYHTYIAEAKAPQEQSAALQHPRWEIRSAAVDALSTCDPQCARELLLRKLFCADGGNMCVRPDRQRDPCGTPVALPARSRLAGA